MGPTVEELNKVLQIKKQIKQSIINKGVEITDTTPFADYPSKIDSIESGGGDPFYETMWNAITNNNTDYSYLFHEYKGTILDASNLDTSNVTSMIYMFYLCTKLISLDLSNFNTSNVTEMNNMFQSCQSLTTLDVGSWNTSNVTDMKYMFGNCTKLISLDLSNWDTSNVTNMNSIFYNCSSLTELDASNFNTSKVTNVKNMFYNCNSLHTLRLDNCSNSTINMIINSSSFSTKAIEGVTRTIYCKEENAAGLTPPTNWVFSYVD